MSSKRGNLVYLKLNRANALHILDTEYKEVNPINHKEAIERLTSSHIQATRLRITDTQVQICGCYVSRWLLDHLVMGKGD
jgi:hypothetical protein